MLLAADWTTRTTIIDLNAENSNFYSHIRSGFGPTFNLVVLFWVKVGWNVIRSFSKNKFHNFLWDLLSFTRMSGNCTCAVRKVNGFAVYDWGFNFGGT
jgi:hypothetical protein